NFIRRIPTWAVLIALEENREVTAGVVYQPAMDVLHTALRGQGARRDGELIRVSPVDQLERAPVVHSSVNFLRRSPYWDGFLRLVDRTQVQRGFGDFSAYLWVAEGQGEIALSTTVKAWDVAALKILVEEAGGRLTDLDGQQGIYGSTVFASNGLLHGAGVAGMPGAPWTRADEAALSAARTGYAGLRRLRQVRLGVRDRERRVGGERRHRRFPRGVARAHRGQALGLEAPAVGALARV